jgi:hypothetical protein
MFFSLFHQLVMHTLSDWGPAVGKRGSRHSTLLAAHPSGSHLVVSGGLWAHDKHSTRSLQNLATFKNNTVISKYQEPKQKCYPTQTIF